jgi:integrase
MAAYMERVAMGKVKFTAGRVESARCPEGKSQAFIWDNEAPGLGLRVTAGGAKSFIFQSRFLGETIRMTIGEPSVWPLGNQVGPGGKILQSGVREEARRLQALIDSGRDPRRVKAEVEAEDRAEREASKAKEVSVQEAWSAYLADRQPHWGARHYRDHVDLAHAGGEIRKRSRKKTVPGPLAQFMGMRLAELDAARMESWAAKEGASRPARARLALRLVKAFLGWCSEQDGFRGSAKPEAVRNKRVREKLGTPNVRQPVLQREQLAEWFAAVQALPNTVISVYLQYMLLTGARPTEPLTLKWEDVSFKWKTIILRDKTADDRKRKIGLTPYVEFLLLSLPRRNEWVFSSPTSSSGQLVDPSGAHDAACEAAGIEKITLQGLRRSFASLCEWIEVPAGVSAQIMGHAPSGVREKNYIRREVDLLRMWHVKIEEWVLEQAGIESGDQGLRVVNAR